MPPSSSRSCAISSSSACCPSCARAALAVSAHDDLPGRSLVGIWAAKAFLNVWRCATGVWRIHVALPRRWRREGGVLDNDQCSLQEDDAPESE